MCQANGHNYSSSKHHTTFQFSSCHVHLVLAKRTDTTTVHATHAQREPSKHDTTFQLSSCHVPSALAKRTDTTTVHAMHAQREPSTHDTFPI